MKIPVKIPDGLVTELARQRALVSKYETHRGFKALAFYLLARSLTTSNGIYREVSPDREDGFTSWSRLNKQIGRQVGLSFNCVNQVADWAEDFGFMTRTPGGYQFVAVDKIMNAYGVFLPKGVITYTTLHVDPTTDSLEHILKTLVFGENFARQEYAVIQKIKRIPGVKEKLSRYIDNWERMPVKELLKRIVAWQKETFANYTKGTEVYDLFHSIHADIALTIRKIREHFCFKSRQSALYIKKVLAELQYITVEKRQVLGNATRFPHEPDGSLKPIMLQWLPTQQKRRWLMPDLITLTLKN